MTRLLNYLRDEMNKYDEPFAQFFKMKKLRQNKLDQSEILEILQKSFIFFSIAEDLETQSKKWQSFSSNQVYEILRAIISLNAMPDKERLRKINNLKLSDTELIGFLYVAHLLQFNGYQFGCKLQNTGIFPDDFIRTLTPPMKILKSWDTYLINCQNHGRISSYTDLKNGMDTALDILIYA